MNINIDELKIEDYVQLLQIGQQKFSALDVAKFLHSDMISVDDILNTDLMINRLKKAQRLHGNRPVYHTEKSGWFTTVDDPSAKNGKRKIRKCSEERLWSALAEWYLDNNCSSITLVQIYHDWIEWKTTPNNQSNIRRLEASWNAYYLKEPLSQALLKKPIASITRLDLRKWAESLMQKHSPDKKKFARMFQIIDQCYEWASDEDNAIVPDNLWKKARKKLNTSLIAPTINFSDDSQVFTDDERRRIKEMVYEDLNHYAKQASSAGLQILFLFETGLRIGECCGLKWTDIKDNRLYIRRQADNLGIKEKTKTAAGYRDIPLTKEALQILEDVRAFNAAHGYTAEWIFQSNNADYDYRLSYNAADRKLRKLCARLDTVTKSPHKCRKTCISALLDSPDINNRTVQRFAGHQQLTTTFNYYNFERRSKEEQAAAIDKALSL